MTDVTWRRLQPMTFDRNEDGGFDVVLHLDVIAVAGLIGMLISLVIG